MFSRFPFPVSVVVTLTLLLSVSSAANAQIDVNRWATAFTPDQLTDIEEASLVGTDYPTSGTDLYYVRFSDSESLNNEELYTVRLLDDGLDYFFDVGYVEVEDNGSYYLGGTIANSGATFEYTDGEGFNGTGLIGDQVFDFIPITDKLSHIRNADVDDSSDDGSSHCFDYEDSSEV